MDSADPTMPESDSSLASDSDGESTPASIAVPMAIALALTFDDPIPPLRQIRARVVDLGEDSDDSGVDRSAVLLEDLEGCTPQPAVLSIPAYQLALFFDGRRSAQGVVEAFQEKFGHRIGPQQALDLQNELERASMLQSSTFEESLRNQLNAYIQMDAWPATHAGSSYPADALACAATVELFFKDPDGPGALPASLPPDETRVDLPGVKDAETPPAVSETATVKAYVPTADTVRALIVPHIDLRVGGATYAHGYRELMEFSESDLIVILGVAHQPLGEQLFSVSQKDFQTPLGTITTNRGIAHRIHQASGADAVSAELTHRGEFSIEFQAMLLRALLVNRCKRDIEIIPVLCGPIEPYLAREAVPAQDAAFLRFTDSLRGELEKSGRKWCVMCSVDLSHVGPEFGHSTMMDERMLKPLERLDRRMLANVEALDADGFYSEIVRTQNSRHVDGVLSILAMLQICEGVIKEGKLLHYDQMMKEQMHSAVSYAAMSFRQ